MDIYINSNKIALNDNMFIASGGEGDIYGKDKTIYKLYHPGKTIALSKIKELQELKKDNIISPKDIVYDKVGNILGYSMTWLKDAIAMCKIFTNDFRNKNNFTNEMVIELVKQIIMDTKYIHSKKCLIVDGNELNYLVSPDFKTPYFIDCDSYKTPSFEPTALMDSIKDYHTQGFNELTDWFAFAILATQLFVGTHPYGGRHPDFKKYDQEGRMKANVSIFDKNVTVNSAVRDFGLIPTRFKDWLIDVFQKGNRSIPPNLDNTFIAIAAIKNIVGSNTVIFNLIKEFSNNLINVSGNCYIEQGSIYTDAIQNIITGKKALLGLKDGKLNIKFDFEEYNDIIAESFMVTDNTIVYKNYDKITQCEFMKIGNNHKIVPVTSWTVMPNSTKLYEGVFFQKALGKLIINIPYKNKLNNKRAMFQSIMPELQGYDIYDAKYERNILYVVATKNGKVYSFIFKFDDIHTTYSVFVNQESEYHNPNFTVLDNGICVLINTDDELLVFNNNYLNNSIKTIKDKNVRHDIKLYSDGMKVLAVDMCKLFRIKLS